MAPSLLSQSFPNFISPSPKRSSPTTSTTARKVPTTSQVTPRPKNTTTSRWKALDEGILSLPAPSPSASSARKTKIKVDGGKGEAQGEGQGPRLRSSGRAGPSRSKKRKSEVNDHSQARLASFGFFKDEPERAHKESFDLGWGEEENLEFEEEREDNQGHAKASTPSAHVRRSSKSGGKSLLPVPDAPYHPSLRKAGIEELKRREARTRVNSNVSPTKTPTAKTTTTTPKTSTKATSRAQAREMKAPTPATPSLALPSDTSSSPTSSSLPPKDESARDWLEGISHRRTSEFGSLSEL